MRDDALRQLQRRSSDVEALERLRVEARRRNDPKPHMFDVVVLGSIPGLDPFYYRAMLWKAPLLLVPRPNLGKNLDDWVYDYGFLHHFEWYADSLPYPFSDLPDYRTTHGIDGAKGRWSISRLSEPNTMRLATREERRDWVRFIGGAYLDCASCGGTGSRYDESVQPRLRIQCPDCLGTGFPS